MMLPPLGPTLKEKDATKWLASLRGFLVPGEEVRALARFSTLRPLTDAIAITDRRVIAFYSVSVGKKGPLVEIPSSEIGRADANTKFGGRTLTVHAPGIEQRHVGTMRQGDVNFVVQQVNAIAGAREPEAPTVDVYDPFSKPWEAPSVPAEGPRPQFEQPSAQNRPPQPISEEPVTPEPVTPEPVAPEPFHGANSVTARKPKRLVPLWKSVPLLVVIAFFGLVALVGASTPGVGLAGFLVFTAFALIPFLVLTSIRRRATRRRAEAAGSIPLYGLFERNWVPVGIPLAIVLFAVGIAIS